MSRSTVGLALKAAGALLLGAVVLYVGLILLRLLQAAIALAIVGVVVFAVYKLATVLLGSDDSSDQSWNSTTADAGAESTRSTDDSLSDLLPGTDEEPTDKPADTELQDLQEQYVDGELTDEEFELQMEALLAEDEPAETDGTREREQH